MTPLITVENLSITQKHSRQVLVDSVSFSLNPGASLAFVGESGSGKSLTSLALAGLTAPGLEVSGTIIYEGLQLDTLSPRQLRVLRGRGIAYVFQDAPSALNPYYSIGFQLRECLHVRGLRGSALEFEARALMQQVSMGVPELKAYPHELSGGMCQRCLIAMALACQPKLLVADEPTTALDSILQREIVDLIVERHKTLNMALLFITHNLGLAQAVCEDCLVLYRGQAVEYGPTGRLLKTPYDPYTQRLVASVP